MKNLLIGGAGLLALGPALAQAAPAPTAVTAGQAQRAPAATKAHTRADVQAKVAEHFARLDTDRDGFVTRAEADAATQARRGHPVHRVRQRAGETHGQAFDRADTNGDGSISRSEWDAAAASRQQRFSARRARDGDGRPDARRFSSGMHALGALHGRMFETADGNRDGRVSLQEAQTAALRHFDLVDVNRDGRITREERMQMRQRMRAARRPS